MTACNLRYKDEETRFFELARQEVREDPPSPGEGDTVELRGSRICEMVHELAVDGVVLDSLGSAVAGAGQEGTRYVCAWSGEGTADVQLEIVLFSSDAAYEAYADGILARPDNTAVGTSVGTMQVAPAPEAGSEGEEVTTAVLLDEDERGGIALTVEPTDPELAASWTAEDTAAVLAELLAAEEPEA